MTAGELLVLKSSLGSATALDHLMNLRSDGLVVNDGVAVEVTFMPFDVEVQEQSVTVEVLDPPIVVEVTDLGIDVEVSE